MQYSYSTQWGDQLSWYNDDIIMYDGMGCPIVYRDGMQFSWLGRRLETATYNGSSMSYLYNADGVRTSKTVNGVTTYYALNGTQIISQKTGDQVLYFDYDAQGKVMALTYNNSTYYYVYNILGEILGLVDSNGTPVVTYTYDPWGKLMSMTDTTTVGIGTLNPFRYKGYYYDPELGFYYLNSRYYDPVTSRFISPDIYISTGQGMLGFNMYAYCLNNPVMGYDPMGHSSIWGCITDVFASATSSLFGSVVATATLPLAIATGMGPFSAMAVGVSTGATTTGAVNNSINAVYYNYISEGDTDIETDSDKSTYVDEYVSRWDRLDYTKKITREPLYNQNAWRFHSEYSLHEFGWYLTNCIKEGISEKIDSFRKSFELADVKAHEEDSRPIVRIFTKIWGILGF